MKRECKTCAFFYQDFCTNDKSVHLAELVSEDDHCEQWNMYDTAYKNKIRAEIQKARAILNHIEKLLDGF